jgi:malonate-semialdehyde dehydrogenase (acetylating)/methylmalonate-semialdehyde dehydrogenase
MKQITHFINGAATNPSKRIGPVFNPALGEQSAEVSLASSDEVAGAIEAAKAAFIDWSETTPLNRSRVLFRFKMLLEERLDELARVISAVFT